MNKQIIWPLEPHTLTKHLILRKYLDAWLPIITRYNQRVLYIDGFAGPSEYSKGEDGSPIIALKSIIEHKFKIQSEIKMVFIEEDTKRFKHLISKINTLKIPKNIKIVPINDKFTNILSSILKFLEDQQRNLAPSFVFIDPFGFSGISFNIIKKIMSYKKCEVFITFMYEEINRFIANKKIWNCLDDTFGTDTWRKIINVYNPEERKIKLFSLYKDQLISEAKITYINAFTMLNKSNKPDYFLFFGTNNIKGLSAMKRAMWKADPSGSFRFSDFSYNPGQGFLIEPKPDYELLKKIILDKFKGKTISLGELEVFVLTKTPFLETHYKKQILLPLQDSNPPVIEIIADEDRRKNSFKPHYKIKFL